MTTKPKAANTDDIKDQLKKLLNYSGYGFQYSALEKIRQFHAQRQIGWEVEAAEFPAKVQDSETHIDFILRYRDTQVLILAECKRVNPKLSEWCFIKAPFVHKNRSWENWLVDHVEYAGSQNDVTGVEFISGEFIPFNKFYHIGFVTKSKEKGEPGPSGKKAIDDAATQVCRGLNGLIEYLPTAPHLLKKLDKKNIIYSGVTLLPVIFTTAQLYTCECNLAKADLTNGNIDLSKEKISEQDWIFYQYHVSPGLKHSHARNQTVDSFSQALDYEYIRTIPIVSVKGIRNFLKFPAGLIESRAKQE